MRRATRSTRVKVSKDVEVLTECPPGTASSAGAAGCEQCEAGKYTPESASTYCLDASAGYFVAEAGASEQTPCPRGHFSSLAKATECKPCPRTKFTNNTGQPECELCEAPLARILADNVRPYRASGAAEAAARRIL